MQNFIEEVTLCYSLIYGFTSHVLSYINHLYKRSKHKFVNDYEAHMPRGVCENRYFPKQVAEPCTKTDFLHNAIHLQKKKSLENQKPRNPCSHSHCRCRQRSPMSLSLHRKLLPPLLSTPSPPCIDPPVAGLGGRSCTSTATPCLSFTSVAPEIGTSGSAPLEAFTIIVVTVAAQLLSPPIVLSAEADPIAGLPGGDGSASPAAKGGAA